MCIDINNENTVGVCVAEMHLESKGRNTQDGLNQYIYYILNIELHIKIGILLDRWFGPLVTFYIIMINRNLILLVTLL